VLRLTPASQSREGHRCHAVSSWGTTSEWWQSTSPPLRHQADVGSRRLVQHNTAWPRCPSPQKPSVREDCDERLVEWGSSRVHVRNKPRPLLALDCRAQCHTQMGALASHLPLTMLAYERATVINSLRVSKSPICDWREDDHRSSKWITTQFGPKIGGLNIPFHVGTAYVEAHTPIQCPAEVSGLLRHQPSVLPDDLWHGVTRAHRETHLLRLYYNVHTGHT